MRRGAPSTAPLLFAQRLGGQAPAPPPGVPPPPPGVPPPLGGLGAARDRDGLLRALPPLRAPPLLRAVLRDAEPAGFAAALRLFAAEDLDALAAAPERDVPVAFAPEIGRAHV